MPERRAHSGLFETVLVAAGRPVELDRHLRRMSRSARQALAGDFPESELREAAAAAASGVELGRMRIDLEPGDAAGALSHRIAVEPLDPAEFFPPRSRGAELRSVERPGGTGSHKLSARDWLEGIERELGDEVPLLVDNGEVLEAGRANVFAVLGGRLVTPPADGRILAGTARAVTLGLAGELGIEASERKLCLDDLRSADEVFLTSSLRGVRPARLLDDEPLGTSEEVSGPLAAALRRRWLGEGALS